MEQNLFRIVYCSRNLSTASAGLQTLAMIRIFDKARSNNARRSVTGALLSSSGLFAQVLEGPRAQIEEVFGKIQQDARHGDVTVLGRSDLCTRDFPDWSMAHVRPVTKAQELVTRVALERAIDSPGAAGAAVLELLRSLVIEQD